jgi:diguanylate cyclase (GGDEF)-like protein/PAS domain S-box-containing protein
VTLNYQSFFERSLAGVFRQTLDGRLVDCNEACANILGYESPEDLLNTASFNYISASDPLAIQAALRDLGSLAGLEVGMRAKNGRPVWVFANLSLVEEDGQQFADGIMLEITEQRAAAERFEQHAYHDPLTGLPNRTLFVERMNVFLAQARRHKRPLAVMFIDLDHFELINTTFGPGLADRLLKVIGDRLWVSLRTEDTVARFGSDEFVVSISEFGSGDNIAIIAQRLLDAVSRPETIDGHEIYVNSSIGIAVYPEDGTDSDTLIKNGEAAMYRAKQLGRNTYRLYQPEANARAFERQTLVTALKRALEREEFVLHYQPQVNVQTGKIDVVEALLRWRHPEMGLVEPSAFLPAAEEGHLMSAIGQWVMREVCRQLKLWQQLGLRPITMGVNLSPRQFGHGDLLAMVERSIRDYGIDPSLIELEVSQEAVNDPDSAVPRLTALKKIGVRIAIDDFGTGRTALSDLKLLPIDAVKIDKAFIRNVTTQSDDAAIVEAVIRMARGFDIRVVAEGVETKDQMTFLWNRRCTDMQGFFFGKPLPAAALEETLRMQH